MTILRTRTFLPSGKSIRRDVIEGEFEELLGKMEPSRKLFALVCAMFRELWDHRHSIEEAQARTAKVEVTKVGRQIEQLLDKRSWFGLSVLQRKISLAMYGKIPYIVDD